MLKTIFAVSLALVANLAYAEVGQTVIVRGPMSSGFWLNGKIDCMKAFQDFGELSGADEFLGSKDVSAGYVGMTKCFYDGVSTNFQLYARFIPKTPEGEKKLADMISRRAGADFHGNTITFEVPTHILMETKFTAEGPNRRQLRKLEILPNENQEAIGGAFSAKVKAVMDSQRADLLQDLIVEQFGARDDDFIAALATATQLRLRKSPIYIFDTRMNSRSLDWFWQYYGADLNCEAKACPR